MLDEALRSTPGLEHRTFGWREAFRARYDVIHFHWPEALIEGRSPARRLVKRLRLQALLQLLRLRRVMIARTVHNLELPSGISGWDRRMLQGIYDRARVNIVLNAQTEVPSGARATLIPHGHYVDWFAEFPRSTMILGRIAFVGLVRRYKGVEQLIAAYSDVRDAEALGLTISGRPTSEATRAEIEELAAGDDTIHTDLRYLSEADYVTAVTEAEIIALPYTHMHNSGSVLAALSLDRPVLVPDNEVNRALADECGPGWVHLYDPPLTGDDLLRALHASRDHERSEHPTFLARDWADVGAAHRDAYLAALSKRRTR